MDATDLTLGEQLLLLAYEPEGRTHVNPQALPLGLAGAFLLDGVLAGRIDLDGKHVVVTDPTPTGDALVDETIVRIGTEPKPRKPDWWVRKLAGTKPRQLLLQHLIDRGILAERPHKALGIFPTTRYSEVDPVPERQIRHRLHEVVVLEAEPDGRSATLAALVRACDMRRQAFPKDDRKQVERRMKELSTGVWAGRAVEKSVQAAQAAVVAAVAASAGAAGGAGSGGGGGGGGGGG